MKLRFLAAAIMLVFAGAVFVLTGGPSPKERRRRPQRFTCSLPMVCKDL